MILTPLYHVNCQHKRYIIHQGGTSSGKTWSILQYLAVLASKYRLVITVVSQTLPHLKKGAMRDLRNILTEEGTEFYEEENLSSNSFTFIKTGTIIEFFGADGDAKQRGARRDILFVNECNTLAWETFRQLNLRTKIKTILDFNPVSTFWVHDKLIPRLDMQSLKQLEEGKTKVLESSYVFRVSTYLDAVDCKGNTLLEQAILDEIQMLKYDPNEWRVYGEGQVGMLSGIIFPNVKYVPAFPKTYKWCCHGLDFGYTNDPTALVKVALSEGEIYCQELVYQKGLVNVDEKGLTPSIHAKLQALKLRWVDDIIADSAEPKSIKELRNKGWNIREATKGPGSVNLGIDSMKRYQINVVSSGLNITHEFKNYRWKINKADGEPLNEPDDNYNHCIDAIRYVMAYKMGKKQPIFSWGQPKAISEEQAQQKSIPIKSGPSGRGSFGQRV